MALFGFNRSNARTLRGVAQSVRQTSNKNQHLQYPNAVQSLLLGKKQLVRFTLDSALTTAQASRAATITNQYGQGVSGGTAVTVYNLETSSAGVYVFEGDSGDAGLAMWDSGTDYRIIQMECP